MIFNWFKKKKCDNFPQFWKEYLEGFNQKKEELIENTRFVVFDTETTGFDKKKDRVLSIGAVSLKNNVINVNDIFELYVEQEIFKSETVKIHGLLKKGVLEKVNELEAIKLFLKYIKNDILVAHHIGFDYAMINQILNRHGLGKLKNKLLDTGTLYQKSKHLVYRENQKNYSLDDLCEELNVSKNDRHTASGDALITAVVFLKTLSKLKKSNDLDIKNLF
ncbi:3'-5' exonuclease [Urechidicola croceus]|uniref:DNA polymerase III subunit epsilon n=1 Tax=Urechidicola croceus TaxID=1850246 RepID=A0A1D8P420_9FLAO|nr:3'-5' exonuclease [Urechidicola croceus]AOW19276.1 DNA polymerase III subunit epsilon [Urechidicola croceus]